MRDAVPRSSVEPPALTALTPPVQNPRTLQDRQRNYAFYLKIHRNHYDENRAKARIAEANGDIEQAALYKRRAQYHLSEAQKFKSLLAVDTGGGEGLPQAGG